MKKWILLTMTIIGAVMSISNTAYAQNAQRRRDVQVTAVKVSAGTYRKEVYLEESTIQGYEDDITIEDIKNIASQEEINLIDNAGKTMTIITSITSVDPDVIESEQDIHPEISDTGGLYSNSVVFDINLFKKISEDTEGNDIISTEQIFELQKPISIRFKIASFDADKQTIKNCALLYVHDGTIKTAQVTYNKVEKAFDIKANKFSNYYLFYTPAEIQKPAPTPAPSPKKEPENKEEDKEEKHENNNDNQEEITETIPEPQQVAAAQKVPSTNNRAVKPAAKKGVGRQRGAATGDDSHMILWLILSLINFIGFIISIFVFQYFDRRDEA